MCEFSQAGIQTEFVYIYILFARSLKYFFLSPHIHIIWRYWNAESISKQYGMEYRSFHTFVFSLTNLFTLMPSRQVFQYTIAEKALVKVMCLQLVHSGHCNNEPAWKYQTIYQNCNTRTPEQDAVNNNLVTPVSKAMPVDYIHSCLKYVIFISSLLDKQNTRRLKMNVRSIICLRHCFHSCTPPQ